MLDMLKTVILGIVEGITEWLPISSTGHMILFNAFMNTEEGFFGSQLYLYVMQLGAILAIATLYFNKLNPFSLKKTKEQKKDTWDMWFKVIAACIPAAIAGLLLNDFMDSISTSLMVSVMLILYGVAFVFIEKKSRNAKISDMKSLSYKNAILIGLFQVLSIIPGTSRSGSTILGGIILGTSRELAAEFSFFLAIPVMVGVSLLKIITNTYMMTGVEWMLLVVGMITAYVVSLISVKFLVNYVRKHDFKVFGYYRIVLGIVVILFWMMNII